MFRRVLSTKTLLQTTTMTRDKDIILMAGDFNGHIGKDSDGLHCMPGGFGIGSKNKEEQGY